MSSHEPTYLVVLGRRLDAEGRCGALFRHRLAVAAMLHRRAKGEARGAKIIITGGDLGRTGVTEARAGADHLALAFGLPAEDLILEEKALDTVSNAVHAKAILLAAMNLEPTIITSGYHLPRASYIFSHVLGPAFVPTYVAAPTGLDEEDYRRHWHSESEKMVEAVRFFDAIDAAPGDHEKVFAHLVPRGYVVPDRVE
jgi:uncharacterized SAM-binding protein YcdF (DUF218 family)